MSQPNPALIMENITKRFPGVLANDQVSLTVQQGEIHALLGENGAGKSTLMAVLTGLYRPENGTIAINGEPVTLNNVKAARQAGIGMVHQHFMLVPTQTVAENLILGRDDTPFFIDYAAVTAQIEKISQKYGLAVDPQAKVWQLSVGEQQRVEILKALYHGAQILILDEPTAVLTPQEVADLFVTLRTMAAQGHTILFISHKLDEVLNIADNVTIMRKGKVSDVVSTATATKASLARGMVGREVLFRIDKQPSEPKKPILTLNKVRCLNARGLTALDGVSFDVRGGEIVGIAGVTGNGQTELAEVITGLRPVISGTIRVNGEDVTNRPPRTMINAGVAHIPADRHAIGSAPNLGVDDNLIMKGYRKRPLSSSWRLNLKSIKRFAVGLISKFDIKTPSETTPSRLLSGGNLQKLIIAREFELAPNLIVAVYPSRGVDVGATEAVHRALLAQRDRGAAVLLISEDLDELLSLSDRLLVMFEGQIVGDVPPSDENIEQIGLLMTGETA